ncbi:MAG: efflux RND transporter periplasmic adaptor subunit [Gemmatimonadaceae bacterium]
MSSSDRTANSSSESSHPPTPQHEDPHPHHVDVGSAPPVTPASTTRMVIVGLGVAAVLAVLLIAAFLPRRAVTKQLATEAGSIDAPPVVQVANAVRAGTGGDLTLPGTIQALHEATIYARVGGYVKSWSADIGKLVHVGDVLAEIDAPELDESVRQAEQQVAQTRAALGLAKADLARWRSLAADSAVSREELDQKTAAYDAAEANTGAAEANVRRLVQMQRYTKVTAPLTGVVTSRNIDIGSLISAAGASSAPLSAGGAPTQSMGSLFRIAETDTVRTYISVPESDALTMRAGLTADVTVQELPNRQFVGRIARTSQALDAGSRTLLVEVDIANPGLSLLTGMYADVHLHLTRTAPSIILPASALVIRSNGTEVAVVDDAQPGHTTTVHLRPVVVGRDLGGTIEIQSGITEGMPIVSNPTADLQDGMKVKVGAGAASMGRAPTK